MNRANRIALFLAAILVVVLAGSVLANRTPTGESPGQQLADESEPPDQTAIDHAVDRLVDAGVDEPDPVLVNELATEYGVGGMVRILAWADEGVATVEDIRTRRAEGEGWGQIAKDLGVDPGIGSIMGNAGGNGQGLGRENAPGQQNDDGADD